MASRKAGGVDTSGYENKINELINIAKSVIASDLENQISDGIQKGIDGAVKNTKKAFADGKLTAEAEVTYVVQ